MEVKDKKIKIQNATDVVNKLKFSKNSDKSSDKAEDLHPSGDLVTGNSRSGSNGGDKKKKVLRKSFSSKNVDLSEEGKLEEYYDNYRESWERNLDEDPRLDIQKISENTAEVINTYIAPFVQQGDKDNKVAANFRASLSHTEATRRKKASRRIEKTHG